LKTALLLLLFAPVVQAQERTIDPTWLHRSLSDAKDAAIDLTAEGCRYKAMFGEGDAAAKTLKSVARFGELEIAKHGECRAVHYEREEELYFVLSGKGILRYGEGTYALRSSDFTYLPPDVRHALRNDSDEPLRVVLMTFRIPEKIAVAAANPQPKIGHLDDVKEEIVGGHPSSVLYKLLAGPRSGKRDAIDEAYVVTSLFVMDFAPGGTNFPHHHETAEEIYLILDGDGEIVAGSGTNGIEGRFPAHAGEAYYFRPNCTVGFYNQDKPGAKAHILAVRSRVFLEEPD
jgi:mannose-6-phosphate isomerase-like protein (cupin superfamily)